MRRLILLFLGVFLLAAMPAARGYTQSREDQDDQRRKGEAEAEKKKKQKEKEWSIGQAPLPTVKSVGPCPFVKVLYDASRWQEFKDKREAAAAVMYTGEIEGVRAVCEYKRGDPIKVQMAIDFALGKGPEGARGGKSYRYWVAVTERNKIVISKQDFDFTTDFVTGETAEHTEILDNITIPRADEAVSGNNFEILVGFDVTPEMADFNRQGKRFRVNAGQTTAAAGTNAAR